MNPGRAILPGCRYDSRPYRHRRPLRRRQPPRRRQPFCRRHPFRWRRHFRRHRYGRLRQNHGIAMVAFHVLLSFFDTDEELIRKSEIKRKMKIRKRKYSKY